MAVPRNRISNARKNNKRSHHAKKAKNVSACSNCGAQKMPHTVCPSCGTYNDKVVVQTQQEG